MEVKTVDINKIENDWSSFCQQSKNISVFHNYFWLNFIEQHYSNSIPLHYGVFEGEKLIGICPVFIQKNDIISLPYSGYGGPRFIKYDKKMMINLGKRIITDCEKIQSKQKEISEIYFFGLDEKTARALKELGFIVFPEKVYPILEIDSIDSFWGSLSSNNRKNNYKKSLFGTNHCLKAGV